MNAIRSCIVLLLILCCLPSVKLSQAVQQKLLDVDFETSTLGGFTQSQIDQYDWQWRTGRNQMHVNGPAVDHSTTTSAGHFMFVNTVSWRSGSKAELYSPNLPASGSNRCVRYYFYMTGITPGSLTVRVKSGTGYNMTSEVVGQQSGDKGQGWHRGMASLPPIGKSYQITFEATSDSTIGGEIAIDDVEVLNSSCPSDEFQCSFESPDLCGFIQDPTDDGNLVYSNGKTDSFYTGPSFDHTFQNSSGHYVFMEATPLGRDQKVRLITPTLRGVPSDQEAHCLVFWYHMFGMAVDSLAVYLLDATKQVSTLESTEPQWILRGNRGNLWRATEVSITMRTDYKIVFEFSRGVRYDGDIAIDDVMVTSYACPGNHVYANVSSVSCEFEEADICHYVQDRTTDTEDWQWGNGQTYVDFTGPSVDHTRGDELGFYLFFERSVGGGDDARISSPPIQPQRASSCVEFWYHMYGTDVNALIVYINRLDGDFPDRQVWNMTGNQGDRWHRAELMVPASLYPLHLVFHAFGGTQFRDNIAIDDIRLFESAECPEVSPDTPIDEPIPPLVRSVACTFEQGFCNLTQESNDVFDWTLGQGTDANQETENMIDHTYANTTGTYAYIDTSKRFLRTNDKARLKSPLIAPSQYPRCFTFYYFMASKYADFLNVYIVPYGGTETFDPQFVIYGKQEAKWLKATVAIEPSRTTAVYVIIEGVIGRRANQGDIAIDDVRLENNGCQIPEITPTNLPLTANCDFELDRGCGYIQEKTDNFDWIRHRGRTETLDTGPLVDHTKGTAEGFYFYAEASQPQRPGDRAAFLVPPIDGRSQPMCLRFFYHMNGVDTGSLRISMVLPGHQTGSTGLEILRLYGQKMTSWLPANIDVIEVDGPVQIRFEAVIGKSYRSDIAIDDITFLRRPCDGLPSESLCDFEKGLHDCNYEESGGPSIYFQWSWYDSATPYRPALQSLDSLTEEGSRDSFLFIMVGENQISPGSTSNISSPFLNGVSFLGHCVAFNYAVLGSGELQLLVFVESESGASQLLGKLDTSQKWKRATIPLGAGEYYNPFKVTFMAQLNNKHDSDIEVIAIDDIAITVGVCKTGNVLQIEGKHIPVLALSLLLVISTLALIIVCFLWIRRRHRSPFPVMFLQRRQSDEHPITMSLANNDHSTLDTTMSVDEYRS
ncbi:MAM and LDL-receptor class A domain-containing protein 1-like [Lytechinus variegatus]|uniref:MAM and LDL-receptor class A domain-containing protein 1-like n=1 Tax=Lytechinus variegatus TaxID=7654 RepID=UPI001BB1EB77|nr:MAM and LDL-receptor class A domain-containing protein 1-like [Lytechinus variegatus]